jgi:hypothetical protein
MCVFACLFSLFDVAPCHVTSPGTLVRAMHCIIEKIGRSGCEAENGGVVELQHCVVQVLLPSVAFSALVLPDGCVRDAAV